MNQKYKKINKMYKLKEVMLLFVTVCFMFSCAAKDRISSPTTPTQYTLTVVVNPQGAGSVTLSPTGGSYAAGTEVTLVATANAGYTFSGWSGDLTGTSNPATIIMDSNKVVVANFTQSGGGGGGATTVIFADSGAIGFVGVYYGGGTQFAIDLDYTDYKEGSSSMRADVTGAVSGWGGWYVEEGGPGGTETADMSAYSNGYLKFWAKSPIVLQISVLSINQNPDTANSKILLTGTNSYGFVADNEWHEVSIPLSAFKNADPNLDFSRISTYFSVAVIGDTGGAKSFWIDDVRWTSQ